MRPRPCAAADIVFKIQRPMSAEEGIDELGLLRQGQTLMSPLGALTNKELVQALASQGRDRRSHSS